MNVDKLFEDAMLAQQKGLLDDALDLFAAVILNKPTHSAAWHMRGLVEDRAGRPFNALVHLNQSCALESHQAVWCNRGVIAGKLQLYDEAVASFNKALEFGHAYEPYQNMGDYYIRMGKLEEAAKSYRAAIKCKPNEHGAHENLGRVLIAMGQWNLGYREIYWRHKAEFKPWERLTYPCWEGQPLKDKTIVVYPEGGYGDEILDTRYAMLLKARNLNARVVLEARPAMYALSKYSLTGLEVIPQYEDPSGAVDYTVGISDLPQFLNLCGDNIPYTEGYLLVPPGPKPLLPPGLKVGLCWLTGKRPLQKWTDRVQKAKSIPLHQFSSLFENKEVTFISLQLDRADPTVMRKIGMFNPMDNVRDLADTARIMEQLDLVIGVDTSVTHLAGALRIPCWNLIRFDEIATYPGRLNFYDSMTFYRQTEPDNWNPIIDKLTRDFERWVDSKSDARSTSPAPSVAAEAAE